MPDETSVSRRSFLQTGSAAILASAALAGEIQPSRSDPVDGSAAATLKCRKLSLTIAANGPVRVVLADASHPFVLETAEPLSLQLLDCSGSTVWLSATYSSVIATGDSLQCSGETRSPSGSRFHFTDVYTPVHDADAVALTRKVAVVTSSADDFGFLTRFSLHASNVAPFREHDFFIPGIWYPDNKNVPPYALAADLSDDYFIVREDRMPLPLVMMRDKRAGATVALSHIDPDGASCLADATSARVIDERIKVASLGIFGQENPAVALYYPASEGERSYLRGPSDTRGTLRAKRWVERFHPVRVGVDHSYRLSIDLSEQPDFPQAMRHAWRAAFAGTHRRTAKTNILAVYEASVSLIADWSKTTNGAPGLPFRLRLPKGELMSPADLNYQMGFVGQQIPLAYHLLQYGLVTDNAEIRLKGEAIVDFWAASALTPDGLPRTWYDTYPTPHWRRYNTFLRVASDGMIGALMAWSAMRKHGNARPVWLKFCTGFGDWLIRHQNLDGSWYREYDSDSKAVNEGKQNTSHPIRFLIGLNKATSEPRYLEAALRAAEWCYPNIHEAFAYVGGTVDNPNVIDKEAGFLAMEAFLAVHDATGETRWLEAAMQAADFTETWIYSWNVPIPSDDPSVAYPKECTTTGLSIIATGHSGADLFLAGAPFLYYRLYVRTGDTHYVDMARLLLYDTKQTVDVRGSLGYGHQGLCAEALSLAPPRGHGVNTWLPWLTYSMIEPIVRLQEAYGMIDTPTVTASELARLRAKDAEYGRTQGIRPDSA